MNFKALFLSSSQYYLSLYYLSQQKRANSIWENSTALRNNLEQTKEYKKLLLDSKQRLDKNIRSSHTGLNYDLRTIVDPRRHAAGSHPSVALVAKSSVY